MPLRPRVAGPAALSLLLLGSAAASAQTGISLNRAGSGARAAGMANAFIAVSDDGTAASWNPAGLAQLRMPELSLVYGVSNSGLRISGLRSPDNLVAYSTRRSDYTNSSPDFASAALPFALAGKPVTLQLGWQRVYRLSATLSGDVDRHLVNEPGTPPTTLFLDSQSRGNIDVLSLAGAVKLTGHTSLGASLEFWRGEWTDRGSLVEPAGATSSDFVFSAARNRLRGHTLATGLLLAYPTWNAGLVYHFPFSASLRVHRELRSSQAPPSTLDGGDRVRLRFPRSLGAGLAWRPAPRWTLALDLTHDQWTETLVEGFPGAAGPVSFFDGLPADLSTTRDTVSLNLGAEHLIVREGWVVPLRLGLAWEPQGPMDAVTRDPADYVMISGGGGYNTNRFKLDAAVQFRWGSILMSDTMSVRGAFAEGLARDAIGRARSHEWRIKVSAIYRIPDTERLAGLLRKIFG